jgi:hypothetical protein
MTTETVYEFSGARRVWVGDPAGGNLNLSASFGGGWEAMSHERLDRPADDGGGGG